MSKPIKMTAEYAAECRADFEKAMQSSLADGKLSFTKTFPDTGRKAVVYFTAEAWAKMVILLRNFDKEVAWHGVAHRGEDDSKDEYVISDILVYPQTVTGATVEMDTEEYSKWLMENVEDERFDAIRMQGHSHVNMGVTPSGVDLAHQEEILGMLGADDFYIFQIWNKSFSNYNKIYDLGKNVLFEDKDVTVKLLGGVEDLGDFLSAAKQMVKSKVTVTPTYAGPSEYGWGGYNSPYGQYPGVGSNYQKPAPAAASSTQSPYGKPRTHIDESWNGVKKGG